MAELRDYEYELHGMKTTGQLTEAHAKLLGATPVEQAAATTDEEQPARRRTRAPRNKARDDASS